MSDKYTKRPWEDIKKDGELMSPSNILKDLNLLSEHAKLLRVILSHGSHTRICKNDMSIGFSCSCRWAETHNKAQELLK